MSELTIVKCGQKLKSEKLDRCSITTGRALDNLRNYYLIADSSVIKPLFYEDRAIYKLLHL
jgi:hypothetical protein